MVKIFHGAYAAAYELHGESKTVISEKCTINAKDKILQYHLHEFGNVLEAIWSV